MTRALAAVGLVVLAAGCGGMGGSAAGQPAERPGAAMIRLVRHEFAGRLDRSYAMLVRQQRTAINRDLYEHCPPGLASTDIKIEIVGVHDELFDVPALGKVETKAVSFQMSVMGANGSRIMIPDTGHLIAQDGQWRWTLSRRSFSALLAGACP
jgi:hypothetical protein